MNKKKLAALISVLVVTTLASCGMNQGVTNADESEGYSESSAELLVGTLEYLLNEDKTDKDTDADDTGIFQIKDDETKQSEQEEDNNKIDVVIYYGNGASDKLNTEVSAMEQLTAENIISALAGHNIVPIGTKVNAFEAEEKDKGKALQLDLDKAFREYLKTMNNESEKIILASITATFLEAYDAESIMITVDGKVLETNHAVYEEPFSNAREYIESPQQNIGGK
ncbi:MAG: GerMN domain-containing protein [Lachnospiraceae bacterium]|nr:GerMN domain-containing protein [Lachnospiraceae bacterium]